MKGLTPKQREILQFIERFVEERQYSPSYREIMERFAFRSPGSVSKHLHALKKKGAIVADKQSHRSILPVQQALQVKQTTDIQLPLIGNLTIGYPLELFERPQWIAVPAYLAPIPTHTYLLQVHGDSLMEEWILDGDYLLIEARQEIEPGEIILGLINQHDTVLKRYYPEGQYIRLESQHPQFQPLTVRLEHISIQGVMTGLFRIY
jgi:repressor LexA